jgi:hypothetical protein
MIDFSPRGRSIRSDMLRMRLLFCAFVTVFFPHWLAAQAKIDGLWDASVLVGQAEVPFRFEIVSNNSQIQSFFFEGDKKIGSTSGRSVNNELQLQYEFLDATLTATFDGEQFQGSYRYNRKNGKVYAFYARRSRPSASEPASHPQIAGSWEMKLVGEDKSPTKDQRSALPGNSISASPVRKFPAPSCASRETLARSPAVGAATLCSSATLPESVLFFLKPLSSRTIRSM